MKTAELLNDRNLVLLSAALLALHFRLQRRGTLRDIFRGERPGTTILRVTSGLILAGASLDKIGDPLGFYHHIKECFYFIPEDLQPLCAVVVPWVEFFTGLLILARFRVRGALLLFCALMTLYTLAIAWDVAHGIDCNCSCFDKTSTEKMTWLTVLRDLLFLGIGTRTLLAQPPPSPSKNA